MRLSRNRASVMAGAVLLALASGPATASDADAAKPVPARPEIYAPVTLTADLSGLTAKERQMLGLFIDAAGIMDDLFWTQAYPADRKAFLAGLKDPAVHRFAEMNYGPWDRLEDNRPFVPGVGARPPGVGFYPLDMTKAEFEKADLPKKTSEYTVLRRDAQGALKVVPYSVEWQKPLERTAALLGEAA